MRHIVLLPDCTESRTLARRLPSHLTDEDHRIDVSCPDTWAGPAPNAHRCDVVVLDADVPSWEAAQSADRRIAVDVDITAENLATLLTAPDHATRAGHLDRQLADTSQALSATRTELGRLRNRRSVKLALTIAERGRPAVRAARKARTAWRRHRAHGQTFRLPSIPESRRPHRPASTRQEQRVRRQLIASVDEPRGGAGPPVSVLIPTRNGLHHLRRLMPRLAETRWDDLEVIVVDNGSDDGTSDWLRSTTWPFDLQVVEGDATLNFAQATNRAAATARGQFLLLLNDDVEPITDGWLARLVQTALDHAPAVVGTRLVYPRRPSARGRLDVGGADLTVQHAGVHFVTTPDGPLARNQGIGSDPCCDDVTAVRDVPAVTGACLLIPTDTFWESGGLDERYEFGLEDVDLCLAAGRAGANVIYDGRTVLFHHEFGTQQRDRRGARRRRRLQNRRLFADRWSPHVTRRLFADRVAGARTWSDQPLHVAITLTNADVTAGWGDWYTAHELGDAVTRELGWRVSYLERYGDRWYDVPDDVDVIVNLLDPYELDRVPDHVVSIAWIRNHADRWVQRPWFGEYDLVLGSSERICQFIRQSSPHDPEHFPLAVNPERFRLADEPVDPRCDLVFTGNHWDVDRQVQQRVAELEAAGRLPALHVHGHGWDRVPGMAPHHRGPVAYDELPDVYAAASLVLDDTAGPCRPWDAVNLRVFEAAACGRLVLSDNPGGSEELFDGLLPVYRTSGDLAELAERYLADPEARQQRASELRELVLERHTFAQRARTLGEILARWADRRHIAICVGPPTREAADQWGDWHVAQDLRRALQRRGTPTRVYPLDRWESVRAARADVMLHVFGLSEACLREGQVNVLWNISHPDRVTVEMVDRYDLALIASVPFADELAGECRTPVHPLLQATDPERFHPNMGGPTHELLFVGNSRGVRRKILDDLLPCPWDVAVYGAGWSGRLPSGLRPEGVYVPNDQLGGYYANAAVVLNDHWDDMRERGFVSNRVFDVLASGCVLVSDSVSGLADLVGPDVVSTYDDPQELHQILEDLLGGGADLEARRIAGRNLVVGRHTYDHRAGELISRLEQVATA